MTNVLTLRIDEESRAYFEGLRQRHFPAGRNVIPAHLTLFHQLPDDAGVTRTVEEEARAQEQFTMRVTGVRSLGRGVAYTLASESLMALHIRLAQAFAEDLTAQDRQRFQPHIVVQNKVSAEAARGLLGELQGSFQPMEARAIGLDLWHYLGGPWELAGTFAFAGRVL